MVRPRSSAAMTPFDHRFDQGGAFSLLPAEIFEAIAQLAVHLTQCLHQTVDVWNAGTRKSGRCACRDGARRRTDGNEWLGDRPACAKREQASHQQCQQGSAGHCALGSAHDFVDLLQPCRDAHHARTAGYCDVEKWMSDRVASSAGHTAALAEGRPNLGSLSVIFE